MYIGFKLITRGLILKMKEMTEQTRPETVKVGYRLKVELSQTPLFVDGHLSLLHTSPVERFKATLLRDVYSGVRFCAAAVYLYSEGC